MCNKSFKNFLFSRKKGKHCFADFLSCILSYETIIKNIR